MAYLQSNSIPLTAAEDAKATTVASEIRDILVAAANAEMQASTEGADSDGVQWPDNRKSQIATLLQHIKTKLGTDFDGFGTARLPALRATTVTRSVSLWERWAPTRPSAGVQLSQEEARLVKLRISTWFATDLFSTLNGQRE